MNVVNFFTENLLKNKDNIFLYYVDYKFSYADVNDLARKIENVILNLTCGQIIAIELSKYSPFLYASFMAIWRLKKIVVPISKDWTHNQKLSALKLLKIKTFITDDNNFYHDLEYKKIQLENIYIYFKEKKDKTEDLSLNTNTAYVLFTSGTTGIPKLVPITHKSLFSYVKGVIQCLPPLVNECFSHIASPTFDLFYHDLLIAWYTNSSIVPIEKIDYFNAGKVINKFGITTWLSVPSIISIIWPIYKNRNLFSTIKYSFFMGEALNQSDVVKWKKLAPNTQIYNLYGPTEATIAVSIKQIESIEDQSDVISIGKIFGDTKYKIKHLTKVNDKGELYLSGPQVFSGYVFSHSSSTFEKIDDSLWYPTGDIVSINDNKDLIYHGRKDRQVKICGNRIELQEIELILRKEFNCENIYVTVANDTNGRGCGINVFISSNCKNNIDSRIANLSFYSMIKSIQYIKTVPRNVNGKTDYVALEKAL